jgi:hypothetical protein
MQDEIEAAAASSGMWHDMGNSSSSPSVAQDPIAMLSSANPQRGASAAEYRSIICQAGDNRSESLAGEGGFILSLGSQTESAAAPGIFKSPCPPSAKTAQRKMGGVPRKAPHVQRHDTCMYCYTLHFKCDRAKPSCEGCIKRKTTCTYPTVADIKCTHCEETKAVCMLYICPDFPGCTRCRRHGLNCSLAPRLSGDPARPLSHDAFMDVESTYGGSSWPSKTGNQGTTPDSAECREDGFEEDAEIWPFRKGCRMEVLFDDGYWCSSLIKTDYN